MINEIQKSLLSVHSVMDELAQKIQNIQKQIDQLTAEGVQAGEYHFKTDRPNTMFIYEPVLDGKRKYIHVGTDPEKQEIKKSEIERFKQREQLMQRLDQLQSNLMGFKYAVERLAEDGDRINSRVK